MSDEKPAKKATATPAKKPAKPEYPGYERTEPGFAARMYERFLLSEYPEYQELIQTDAWNGPVQSMARLESLAGPRPIWDALRVVGPIGFASARRLVARQAVIGMLGRKVPLAMIARALIAEKLPIPRIAQILGGQGIAPPDIEDAIKQAMSPLRSVPTETPPASGAA